MIQHEESKEIVTITLQQSLWQISSGYLPRATLAALRDKATAFLQKSTTSILQGRISNALQRRGFQTSVSRAPNGAQIIKVSG